MWPTQQQQVGFQLFRNKLVSFYLSFFSRKVHTYTVVSQKIRSFDLNFVNMYVLISPLGLIKTKFTIKLLNKIQFVVRFSFRKETFFKFPRLAFTCFTLKVLSKIRNILEKDHWNNSCNNMKTNYLKSIKTPVAEVKSKGLRIILVLQIYLFDESKIFCLYCPLTKIRFWRCLPVTVTYFIIWA